MALLALETYLFNILGGATFGRWELIQQSHHPIRTPGPVASWRSVSKSLPRYLANFLVYLKYPGGLNSILYYAAFSISALAWVKVAQYVYRGRAVCFWFPRNSIRDHFGFSFLQTGTVAFQISNANIRTCASYGCAVLVRPPLRKVRQEVQAPFQCERSGHSGPALFDLGPPDRCACIQRHTRGHRLRENRPNHGTRLKGPGKQFARIHPHEANRHAHVQTNHKILGDLFRRALAGAFFREWQFEQ